MKKYLAGFSLTNFDPAEISKLGFIAESVAFVRHLFSCFNVFKAVETSDGTDIERSFSSRGFSQKPVML